MTTIDDAESGRVDNKAGKGDHRHIDNREEPYLFTDPDMLVAEFWRDVEQWRRMR